MLRSAESVKKIPVLAYCSDCHFVFSRRRTEKNLKFGHAKITIIIFFFFVSIILRPKYADGMANSVDPDQTAPQTVCSDMSVLKFRNIMVNKEIKR